MFIQVLLQEQNEVQIELGLHKLLANYQTGGYNFRPMSGWNGKIGSHSSVSERTHKSLKRVA